MERQEDLQNTLPDDRHFNNLWQSLTIAPTIISNGYSTSQPLGLEPNVHPLSDAISCPIEVSNLLELKQRYC
jgi:hypothetical protein